MAISVEQFLADNRERSEKIARGELREPNPLNDVLNSLPLKKKSVKAALPAVTTDPSHPAVATSSVVSKAAEHNADPNKETRIAFRDVDTGEFASPQQAAAHPSEVITDFIDKSKAPKKTAAPKGGKKVAAKKATKKTAKKSVPRKAVKKVAKKKAK